jgi:hypothetical protein
MNRDSSKITRIALILLPVIVIICAILAACHVYRSDAVRVFYPRHPSAEETAASEELARVISIMTNRRAEVGREPLILRPDGFYVGNTSSGRAALPEILAASTVGAKRNLPDFDPNPPKPWEPLPPERWDNVGWAREGGRIAIAGTDGGATQLAVSLFLQRECGVRWWMPGRLGEDIPRQKLNIMQITRHVEAPSYVSRGICMENTGENRLWQMHNLLGERIDMHQQMPGLLTKKVASKHPEWFPSFNEKAYDPATWKGPVPHPVFTNEEVARYIADRACDYFSDNPMKPSFSISPNDTSLFGDLDEYKGVIVPNAMFRGKSDLSNAVFTFYNNVARNVAAEYPKRWLGALAYSMYENVPDFPVAGNLAVFLTVDRSQWYDKDFKDEDLSLVKKWCGAGPCIIGTYDYYYGAPYVVPRVMLSSVCESIPLLHSIGMRAFYAEAFPLWGYDAPKLWIASQLLWNAGQNPEGLKKEFFCNFFGPAAAQMRSFYEECDKVWMNQDGRAKWIKYYSDADQAALFDPVTIKKLREILNGALEMDLPGKYGERVRLVARTFSITERVCAAWPKWEAVSLWTPDKAVRELIESLPDYESYRADMAAINADCDASPSSGKLPGPLGYLDDDDPLAGRLAYLRGKLPSDDRKDLAQRFPEYSPDLTGSAPTRLLKGAFTRGGKSWKIGSWPNPLLVSEFGDGDLYVAHSTSFSAQMDYRAKEGRTYCAFLGADGQVSASSQAVLILKFYDKERHLISFCSNRLPPGELKRGFLAVAGECPKGAEIAELVIIVKDQEDGDYIRLYNW